MNIDKILNLNKKKTNLNEFFNFLFDQPMPYQFKPLNYIPFDAEIVAEKVNIYLSEDNNLFFILEYENKPVLIYEIETEKNSIKSVKCLDKSKYKNLMIYLVNNIKLSDIPN